MTAIVFVVCKGVTLHDRRNRPGSHYLRLTLAPLCCVSGEVDMTKSILLTVDPVKGRAYLDQVLSLLSDPAVQALKDWVQADPSEVRDFVESALLNRCLWVSYGAPTADVRFPTINIIAPEAAGAALRGGVL